MENTNGEGRFNRWFRSEVAAGFAVGAAVIGVFIYLTSPISALQTQQALVQQELAQIKNNDLTHIELEITQINQRMDDFQKNQIVQGQSLTEILTIIKQQK